MQAGKAFRNLFLSSMDFTRLGASCYPTDLLSNKLAYFIQFLKEKIPPPSDGILGRTMRSGTYFFRKTAVHNHLCILFDASVPIVAVKRTQYSFCDKIFSMMCEFQRIEFSRWHVDNREMVKIKRNIAIVLKIKRKHFR